MPRQFYPFAQNEDLPDYAAIREGITKIEEVLKQAEFNFDYESLKKLFFDNLTMMPLTLSLDLKGDIYFYRVRSINESKDDINIFSTFSYPPKDLSRQGRANLKGSPVLYCSLSGMAALKEHHANSGPILENETLYMAVYRIRPGFTVNHITHILSETLTKGTVWESINSRKINQMLFSLKSYQLDKQKAATLLTSYLGYKFIGADHRISSFISHYHLYDTGRKTNPSVDAISYPSVARDRNDFNFAFHPNAADQKLQLVEVQKLRFGHFESNGAYISPQLVGIPDYTAEKLTWKEIELKKNKVKLDKVGLRYANPLPRKVKSRNFFVYENKFDLEAYINRFLWEQNVDSFVKELSSVQLDGTIQDRFTKLIPIRFPPKTIYSQWKGKKYYLDEIQCEFSYSFF